jgi:hypothetical protein
MSFNGPRPLTEPDKGPFRNPIKVPFGVLNTAKKNLYIPRIHTLVYTYRENFIHVNCTTEILSVPNYHVLEMCLAGYFWFRCAADIFPPMRWLSLLEDCSSLINL